MKPWLLIYLLLSLCHPTRAAEPVTLRVLSYNIHHGEGVDRKLDLERIAKVILSVKPDLVLVQEVDRNTQRTNKVDQPAELAKLTKMHKAFGPNIKFQGGDYGNLILSRFPITKHKNHLLPNFDNGEQRGVIISEILVPGQTVPLILMGTHFDYRKPDQGRLESAGLIKQQILKRPELPAVLGGDLNDVLNSPTLKKLQTTWKVANETEMPTVPVSEPKKQIDFILMRPANRWKVVEVKVLDEAVASDHRAILAELQLLPAAAE